MIWRICERWGILPPGVTHRYEDNDPWAEACLLAYEQIREYEDTPPEVKLPNMPKSRGRR